jgi:uncharacterized protein YqeY
MSLRERINDEMKVAMKARDQGRTAAVRLIRAAIQEKDNALVGDAAAKGIGDDEILTLLAKMLKQREESAKVYADAGRTDLEATERAEIAVIREFMPQQLSEAETREAVAKLVGELGAGSMKDMGRVMAALKERHAGAMDFARAGALVKEMLTPK